MTLFRWMPKSFGLPVWELERMRNHMENVYSSLAQGVNQFRKNYSGVFPLVNLSEDGDKLYLMAELPGVDPASLDVSVKGDTLTLRGEVKAAEDKDVNYHRREREPGSFRRSLTLPVKIEVENIAASFKNGILTLSLPKAAEAKAHQISIKTE